MERIGWQLAVGFQLEHFLLLVQVQVSMVEVEFVVLVVVAAVKAQHTVQQLYIAEDYWLGLVELEVVLELVELLADFDALAEFATATPESLADLVVLATELVVVDSKLEFVVGKHIVPE